MDLARFGRHVLMHPIRERRAFPRATLDAIQREISAQEKRHRGQVVFIVEAELGSSQLLRGLGSRQRARQVFATHGVWNTEENNGVLIYLLLADRRVEIVADRGIHAKVKDSDWQDICRRMERDFREGRFEAGSIAGVRAVSDLLARYFPGDGSPRANELPDRPELI
ncbi:MAG TPA: TPM domain-containing protein [Usitatibacter sp.]|nr:TPM domain-containing protein [Usitatibacter sp.]